MNGVVLVTCAIVILAIAYRFYGKWLAKTWGIDPNALTPAQRLAAGFLMAHDRRRLLRCRPGLRSPLRIHEE